ncbi:MAG TPA: head GIN domain-containing protein [Kofleriaceae bacterium]
MKACVIIVLAGCGFTGIAGSGNAKSEVRQVGAFSAIDIAGATDADIAFAADSHVEISGDDNLVPLITTELHGDKLEIGTRQSVRPKLPLVAHITAPRINAVHVSGSGNITIHGVHGDNLTVSISGSGDIRGDGTVQQLTAKVNGSGDLELDQLAAERASVTISGSGDAKLAVGKSLDVTINGSGDVSYRGDPEVRKQINGSGSVIKR